MKLLFLLLFVYGSVQGAQRALEHGPHYECWEGILDRFDALVLLRAQHGDYKPRHWSRLQYNMQKDPTTTGKSSDENFVWHINKNDMRDHGNVVTDVYPKMRDRFNSKHYHDWLIRSAHTIDFVCMKELLTNVIKSRLLDNHLNAYTKLPPVLNVIVASYLDFEENMHDKGIKPLVDYTFTKMLPHCALEEAVYVQESNDSIFNLEGTSWKNLRRQIMPVDHIGVLDTKGNFTVIAHKWALNGRTGVEDFQRCPHVTTLIVADDRQLRTIYAMLKKRHNAITATKIVDHGQQGLSVDPEEELGPAGRRLAEISCGIAPYAKFMLVPKDLGAKFMILPVSQAAQPSAKKRYFKLKKGAVKNSVFIRQLCIDEED